MTGKRPAVDSPPRPTKRNCRILDNELELDDTMPCVATNGHHRPDDQPRDDEFGLMTRYLRKMVKERWPSFKSIKYKTPDWPGDTEKEGLGPHCVWKAEDEVVCRDDGPSGGQPNEDFEHVDDDLHDFVMGELDGDDNDIQNSIEEEPGVITATTARDVSLPPDSPSSPLNLGYTKSWVCGFNGQGRGDGTATFSQKQSVIKLAVWLLEERSVPEINQLTECLLKTGSTNTFLQTAKWFTQAITAPRMAGVISQHFPQQYSSLLQIALELTSRIKELDSILKNSQNIHINLL